MQWRRVRTFVSTVLIGSLLCGCHGPKKLHYLGETELQYYKDAAQEVAYPTVDQATPQEVTVTERPHTIRDRSEDEVWDMTLLEAVHLALGNSTMMRTRATFLNAINPLLTNPLNNPSVYDPAITNTGFLFGNRGVEAALAAFDAQLTTSMLWGRNELVQNNRFFGGLPPGSVLTNETGTFVSGLQKQFANGGLVSVSHNWDYLGTNSPSVLFPSSYTGFVRADFRQPLWAGSGTEFTRIAGPIAQSFGGITGVSQGVTIARINGDISIVDFELSVRNLIRDTEDLYWELYLAYRLYDAELANRNSALQTWREVQAKAEAEAAGGAAADEAQARENYFEIRARVETALSNVYSVENQFRRLLGLPVNDGKIIRPVDEPLRAEFVPEWQTCLAESLTLRPELRRQKWSIKSLELQTIAAESLTNPRLDLVSSYQVNGFGDKLLSYRDNDGITAQGFNSAYETITQGNQTGWQVGFQFTMPLGFRAALAQLRNTELRLAKARAGLAAQELEISHELANSFQQIDAAYVTAQTQYSRLQAAERRAEVTTILKEAGVTGATLDLVLRAQASRAAAEIAYYTSLVRYNQAITDLHFRKGTLLEQNNIQLAEGEWTPLAYREALRRAWARSYGFENHQLHTEPEEFASPQPYWKRDLPSGAVTPASATEPASEATPPAAPAPSPLAPPSDAGPVPETVPLPIEAPPVPPATNEEPTKAPASS